MFIRIVKIFIVISMLNTPEAMGMGGYYAGGIMAGAGAYGGFQGCPYEYEESEELSNINDEISALRKQRKELRKELRTAKKDLKEIQGYNKRGGLKGEALKEMKRYLKGFVVTQVKDHVQDPSRDRHSYKDACADQREPTDCGC